MLKLVRFLQRYRIIPSGKSLSSIVYRMIGLLLVSGFTMVALGGGYLLWNLGAFQNPRHQFSVFLDWQPVDNTIVYDSQGEKIAEVYSSDHIYVPFKEIPDSFVKALISVEDRNFWTHIGVDFKAIARAIWIHLSGHHNKFKQGASTLTQQLVRNFLLPKEKTIMRKIKEIILSIKLEKMMGKEKIFEVYANMLFLGNGAYGIGAAAKRYFNKPLKELNPGQLSLLAGLFQSPSRFNPHKNPLKAKKRQGLVLKTMVKNGYLAREDAIKIYKMPLQYQKYKNNILTQAPYYVDYIKSEAKKILGMGSIKNQGLRIYTHLDMKLQEYVNASFTDLEDEFKNLSSFVEVPSNEKNPDNRVEAAMLVTNAKTGQILALKGGRDYEYSRFNRATQALRQPGSLFKPIIYALALSKGSKWSDSIYVSPITLAGNYRPRSQKNEYMTQTTLLRAFYKSMNSPTLELAQKVGIKNIIQFAQKAGVRSFLKEEYGTALGSSEVSMLDIARFNATIANDGKLVEISGIKEIRNQNGDLLYKEPSLQEKTTTAIDQRVAFLVKDAMHQVLLRGTGWSFNELGRLAAGKTGTTNNSKDNWFAGFSSDIVAVTWVGNDSSYAFSSSANAQGGTLALPIWAAFMKLLIEDKKSDLAAVVPEGVEAHLINPITGGRDSTGIRMWFLKENPPTHDQHKGEFTDYSNTFRMPHLQ